MKQKLEKACRWLFGLIVFGAIVFSTSAFELLPFIIGIVFLAALPGFPDFRRQIHWRRMLIFSAVAAIAILVMYYWMILDDARGTIVDFCWLAIWPLVDDDANIDIPSLYCLSFCALKGLLFGFIAEAFIALNKQRGLRRVVTCVRRDSEKEGNVPPFGLAGMASITCLAVILLSVRFLANLSPRWHGWLIPVLMINGPIATAFFTLYGSSWQRGLSGTRRVVAITLQSSLIFGMVLFIVLLMLLAIGFLASLWVPRGQYGSL